MHSLNFSYLIWQPLFFFFPRKLKCSKIIFFVSHLNGFITGYDAAFIISELWHLEMNSPIFSTSSIKLLHGPSFRPYIITATFNPYYKMSLQISNIFN